MDTNLMPINEATIVLAILGYIGYIFKEIPERIFQYIRQKVTYTIQATTDDKKLFNESIKYIINNFPELNNHLMFVGYSSVTPDIADGTYYLFKDKTLCILHKSRIKEMHEIEKEFTLELIGLNAKKILADYKKHILTVLDANDSVYIEQYRQEGVYVNKRAFSTIYNKNIETIKARLDQFISNKDIYDKLGIPYKTGFLFYGPPGSGKSSLAKAIASYLNWDIRYIAKSSDDDGLSYIEQNTVILFEDIDDLVANRDPDKDDKSNMLKLSLHKILNYLDGVLSPKKCIFIATTNHIDRLDPALIRPGRFDNVFEIGNITIDDAVAMCNNLGFDKSILDELEFNSNITGAMLQRFFLNKLCEKA